MSNDEDLRGLEHDTFDENTIGHPGIIYEESNMFLEKMGQIQEEVDAHDDIYRIMQEEEEEYFNDEDEYNEIVQEDDINAGKLIFPE
jgi:hypothetical protein